LFNNIGPHATARLRSGTFIWWPEARAKLRAIESHKPACRLVAKDEKNVTLGQIGEDFGRLVALF
jgi:hypothetical protein